MLNARIRPYWDRYMQPVGAAIARTKVSPDVVTGIGIAIQAVAGVFILQGRLLVAGLVTIGSGIADILDGAIAKAQRRRSKWGGLFDSTSDRLTDALIFLPLAWLYGVSPDVATRESRWITLLALVALVSSYLVSYVKARAEGLGFTCNVGIAERAERVIIVVLGLVFDIVALALAVLAALSIFTFFQRLVHVYLQARRAE